MQEGLTMTYARKEGAPSKNGENVPKGHKSQPAGAEHDQIQDNLSIYINDNALQVVE